jgi:hypothetical protein
MAIPFRTHAVHLLWRPRRNIRIVNLQLMLQLVEHAAAAAAGDAEVAAGAAVDVVHVANLAPLAGQGVAPEEVEDAARPRGQSARHEHSQASATEAWDVRFRERVWVRHKRSFAVVLQAALSLYVFLVRVLVQ